MADFNELIEYLRLQRRSDEASKNALQQQNVSLDYLETGEEACTTTKYELLSDNVSYKKLSFAILDHSAAYIYRWETASGRKYYVKTNTGTYLNLADNSIDTPPQQELQQFPIAYSEENYFYYAAEGRVVFTTVILSEVTIFGDTIDFGPEEAYIRNISNRTYDYKFTNHRTIYGNFVNLLRNGNETYSEDDVKVTKSSTPGLIELIPIMEADTGHKIFRLWYIYRKKGYRPSFGIKDEDCAIKLEFGSIGGLLSFLNETLFSQGFDLANSAHSSARDVLSKNFRSQILDVLERKTESIKDGYYGLNYLDVMQILFYLPPSVAGEISPKVLWTLVNAAIDKDTLNNRSEIAEENVFIKLLEVLLEREDPNEREAQQKEFIRFLAGRTLKDELRLEYLYNRLDGENNSRFISMVNKAWRKSFFINPDNQANPLFRSTDGPLALPYKSKENWLGFYITNATASFETKGETERLVMITYDTGKTTVKPSHSRTVSKEQAITEIFYYHPFYPVYLKDIEEQETNIKLDAIVPAFMLLANHNKQFWHNVMTAGEYALDVVTTLSGIGNIAKFRYLARVASRAKTLSYVSKGGRALATARSGVALAAGVIEITSGSVNILLKLTGAKKTAFGSAISEYLMWLELLSLAGELTVAIEEGIRKSARELLEHEEALRSTAKNADEAKEIDEVLAHLNDVAEIDFLANWDGLPVSGKGFLGGNTLNRKEIKQWIEQVRLTSKGKSKIIVLPKGHKSLNGNQAGFDPFKGNIYVQRGVTEYEIFHEFKHLEEYVTIGKDAYLKGKKTLGYSLEEDIIRTYKREKYVFDQIMRHKNKFSLSQLMHAQKYIDKKIQDCINNGIDISKIK